MTEERFIPGQTPVIEGANEMRVTFPPEPPPARGHPLSARGRQSAPSTNAGTGSRRNVEALLAQQQAIITSAALRARRG